MKFVRLKKDIHKKARTFSKKVNARAFYVERLFSFLSVQNPLVSGKSTVGTHGHDHSIEWDKCQCRPGKTGSEDGSQRHDHDGVNVG